MSTTDYSQLVTQYQLLVHKKEEQRAKTRERMARFRLRLRNLPPEEQEPFKARARDARARYRATRRLREKTLLVAYQQYQQTTEYLISSPNNFNFAVRGSGHDGAESASNAV